MRASLSGEFAEVDYRGDTRSNNLYKAEVNNSGGGVVRSRTCDSEVAGSSPIMTAVE